MKKIIFIIVLLLLINVIQALEIETGACEGFHLTGTMAATIGLSCLAEWVNIPQIYPIMFVTVICVGKELNDANFSLNDLKWDGIGLGIGISLRLIDGGLK